MDELGCDLFLDIHGDEEIPFNFLAGEYPWGVPPCDTVFPPRSGLFVINRLQWPHMCVRECMCNGHMGLYRSVHADASTQNIGCWARELMWIVSRMFLCVIHCIAGELAMNQPILRSHKPSGISQA
jgi:hypothetical protein